MANSESAVKVLVKFLFGCVLILSLAVNGLLVYREYDRVVTPDPRVDALFIEVTEINERLLEHHEGIDNLYRHINTPSSATVPQKFQFELFLDDDEPSNPLEEPKNE